MAFYRNTGLACHDVHLIRQGVARRFGVDRKTVSKMLEHMEPPGKACQVSVALKASVRRALDIQLTSMSILASIGSQSTTFHPEKDRRLQVEEFYSARGWINPATSVD